MEQYDFSGWATKNDLKCSDGRIIRKDAFKHCDGLTVPLVWGHQHNDPLRVLGHAMLKNREGGVYTYGKFNDTEQGKVAKELVQHGDVVALSIYANQLKQEGPNVLHGAIREVSLVLAGANPGAFIDSVMIHSEGPDGEEVITHSDDEAYIYTGESIELYHADDSGKEETMVEETTAEETTAEETTVEETEELQHEESTEKEDSDEKQSRQKIWDSMSEAQQELTYEMIAYALANAQQGEKETNKDDSKGGNESMKHNLFDQEDQKTESVLSHADLDTIVEMAKKSNYGSFKVAMDAYCEGKESLQHGFTDYSELFPDHKLITPGAPEIIRDAEISWVSKVIGKIKKSPNPRVRTRQADARSVELKAKGYEKGGEKTLMNNLKLINRKTEPQTVYIKDEIHRDDILDIDFDIVAYQQGVMRDAMHETLALAALIGDRREDSDPDKIHEENIRSILNDEELYTIHRDVDIEAARAKIQGTNTEANFSENYIYSEAMIEAALYAREQYKGTGTPDYYCAPHSINVMLLARDLNGRRIYDSKADLAKALNVNEIIEIEQLEGVTRKPEGGAEKKLHGIFVNLSDYQFGCVKGGEITNFNDFDIDFNKYKYLMETRLSGALIKPFAAIVLEEPVVGE